MFGCYRTGDANDPEMYTAAVAAVLADFPPEVMDVVTNPRTGLPRKIKFLPTVSEVADACDAELRYREALRLLATQPRAKLSQHVEHEASPEERERIIQGFDMLLRGLAKTNVVGGDK